MNIDIILARALIDSLLFCEFSGEDIVDTDAAVGQFEVIASVLAELDEAARDRFVNICDSISTEYSDSDGKSAFVRNIPRDFGLVE